MPACYQAKHVLGPFLVGITARASNSYLRTAVYRLTASQMCVGDLSATLGHTATCLFLLAKPVDHDTHLRRQGIWVGTVISTVHLL